MTAQPFARSSAPGALALPSSPARPFPPRAPTNSKLRVAQSRRVARSCGDQAADEHAGLVDIEVPATKASRETGSIMHRRWDRTAAAARAPAKRRLVGRGRHLLALARALLAHRVQAAHRRLHLVGMQRRHRVQLRQRLRQLGQRRQVELGRIGRGCACAEARRRCLSDGRPLPEGIAQHRHAPLQRSLALAQRLILARRVDLRLQSKAVSQLSPELGDPLQVCTTGD